MVYIAAVLFVTGCVQFFMHIEPECNLFKFLKLFELNHVTCVYEEIFRLLNVNAFNKNDVSFYLHKKYQINNSIEKKNMYTSDSS